MLLFEAARSMPYLPLGERIDVFFKPFVTSTPDRREFKLAVRARTATVAHDAELNILERKMV